MVFLITHLTITRENNLIFDSEEQKKRNNNVYARRVPENETREIERERVIERNRDKETVEETRKTKGRVFPVSLKVEVLKEKKKKKKKARVCTGRTR